MQKQKIGLLILLSLAGTSTLIGGIDWGLFWLLPSLPLLTMAFGSKLYQLIGLPKKYWSIPICISMTIPLFFTDLRLWPSVDTVWIVLAVLAPLVLTGTRGKECFEAIKVAPLLEAVPKLDFIRQLAVMSWLLIAEEILFRVYLIEKLYPLFGIASLFIGAIFFVYYHYFNRFASSLYTGKDYAYHACLSLLLGYFFIKLDFSILPCIAGHLIYNATSFTVLILRYRESRRIRSWEHASLD